MSSVRLSLTRGAQARRSRFCAAASSASSASVPPSACSAASVSASCVVRLGQRLLRCGAWRRRRRRSWPRSRAPAAPWRSARRASAPACPASRARAGAGGAPRPAPRDGARRQPRPRRARPRRRGACSASCARQRAEPAALGKPRGGGRRALRGGDEAVPAPQVALARHQALAGLASVRCSRGAVGARRRRRSGAGAASARAGPRRGATSGSTPAGRAGSGRPPHCTRQCTGASSARRRVEVVAERRGQRHLVARRHLDLVEDRRQAAVAGGLQQLGQRLDLGLELAGGEARPRRRRRSWPWPRRRPPARPPRRRASGPRCRRSRPSAAGRARPRP